MRHDFQIFQIESLNETVRVPEWAAYVDVHNDAGCPIDLEIGSSMPVRAETGSRVPIRARTLRVIADASLRAPLPATALPILAFLSHEVALVTPPPSRETTREFQQKETVVQAAAARLITYRGGIRVANVVYPLRSNNVAQAGRIVIADTEAKATDAAGITLEPGDVFEEWKGPLWVFRPAQATNGDLDVTQHVKDLGAFNV